MSDFEVLPQSALTGAVDRKMDAFIRRGPSVAALERRGGGVLGVDGSASSSFGGGGSSSGYGDGPTAWLNLVTSDVNLLMVALCACVVVFVAVLSVFMANWERVRRYATGENRRVGSVYYVRPGIHATQPTEI